MPIKENILPYNLTAREFEVLKLLLKAKTNIEIAEELFISTNTSKAHVTSIIKKFGAKDRIEVIIKALNDGCF